MRQPPKEVLIKALAIVMAGINKQNDSQLVYEGTTALDSEPFESLVETQHALEMAQSSIVEYTDRLILDIRRRRNMAAPIHQLPSEIFIAILNHLADAYSIAGDHRWMVRAMTVNRIWRETIINSSRLWRVIQLNYSLKFASCVVEYSKTQPLSIYWSSSGSLYRGSKKEEFEGVLELAIQNSSRLQSVDVALNDRRAEPALRRLLGNRMPQLESLRLASSPNMREGEVETGRFPLPGDGPLKELVLSVASLLNWDSQMLSGLRVLELESVTPAPTALQILRILSASPTLMKLSLNLLDLPETNPPNHSEESPGPGERLIELPHLTDISLDSLPPLYYSYILPRIRLDVCNTVWMFELDSETLNWSPVLSEDLWATRSDTMAALLLLPKTGVPMPVENDSISISIDWERVDIRNCTQRGARGSSARSSTMLLRFSYNPQPCINVLGRFFSSRMQIPHLSLTLTHNFDWQNLSIDLRPFGCSLTSLEVRGHRLCRIVQKQLGEQYMAEDGTPTWVCPNLSSIELFYMDAEVEEDEEMDGVGLLLAVQRRWSGEGGIAPATQPSTFYVGLGSRRISSILTRESMIKSIVPVFELDYY